MSERSPTRSVCFRAHKALVHERAVQAGQRNHVADRPEGDQLEQRKEIGKHAGEIAPSEQTRGAPLPP